MLGRLKMYSGVKDNLMGTSNAKRDDPDDCWAIAITWIELRSIYRLVFI